MIRRGLAVIAVALLAAGCPHQPTEDDVVLYGLTAAPPGTTATVTSSDAAGYTIELTRGVAIAARCWDSCDYACVAPRFVVGDPGVLGVRAVWRATGATGEIALIAGAPGTTTLQVETGCTSREYTVRVVAP